MDNISEPRSRGGRHASAKPAPSIQKFGWRPGEWAAAIGCSRSRAYQLVASGTVDSVKFGASTIILTPPIAFLRSLAGDAAA